jgi:RHS repeat-associated protein
MYLHLLILVIGSKLYSPSGRMATYIIFTWGLHNDVTITDYIFYLSEISMKKYFTYLCLLPILSLVLFTGSNAPAQMVDTGMQNAPPIPTVGHSYLGQKSDFLKENVDPATGGVGVSVALPMPSSRGLTLPVSIQYSSQGIYQNTQSTWSMEASPELGIGWTFSIPHLTIATGDLQYASGSNGETSSPMFFDCPYLTGYLFTDSSGAAHSFPTLALYPKGKIPDCTGVPLFDNTSSFTPGATYTGTTQDIPFNDVTALPQPVVITDNDGTTYSFNQYFFRTAPPGVQVASGFASTIEDRNGNLAHIAWDGNSLTYNDTNGRSAMSISSTTPHIGEDTLISVSGLVQPYRLSWQNFGQSTTSFGQVQLFNDSIHACKPEGFNGSLSNMPVVQTLTLPNNLAFKFTYDPALGLLKSIQYPSGALISYDWRIDPQSQGIEYIWGLSSTTQTFDCQALTGTPRVFKRVVSLDGVNPSEEQDFDYKTTFNTFRWNSKTTTVTTKDMTAGGVTTSVVSYTYQPYELPTPFNTPSAFPPVAPLEVSTSYSDGSGNLLKQVTQGWFNPSSLGCSLSTIPGAGISGSWYSYASNSAQLTDTKTYNVGQLNDASACTAMNPASPSIVPIREVATTYHSFSNQKILDKPDSYTVYDNGRVISQTQYTYEAPRVSANAVRHDAAYETGDAPPAGNPASIKHLCLTSCADSTTTFTYDFTGQVVNSTDALGHTTSYSYVDNSAGGPGNTAGNSNAYVTSITAPDTSVAHKSAYGYDYATGNLIQSTDENNHITTYQYNDPLARLTGTFYPDGGSTTHSYHDASPISVTTTVAATPDPNRVSMTVFDGLGRIVQTQLQFDPTGTVFTDTTYDGIGRVASVSNPHRSSSESSDGVTTYGYDALNRMTKQINPDGSNLRWSYNGNAVDFFDEASHHWQRITDGLGRLMKVMEPDGNNNPTMETDYQYDALGNLTRVDQWGGASGSQGDRIRSFTYDGLSNLRTASNPESGTVSYIYDANGNVTGKTDARGITVSYMYDALNRMINKTSAGGSGVPGFNYLFGYDAVSPPVPNGIGRLLFTTTSPGVAAGVAEEYSYDAMGRMTSKATFLPSSPRTPATISAVYDLAGSVTSLTYPDGRTVNQQWNGAGEVLQITDGSGFPYLTGQSAYWPNGTPQGLFYGNGVANGYHLNNRLQIDEIGHVQIGVAGATNLSVKEYCYGPATAPLSSTIPGCPPLANANNGNIWMIMDTLNGNNSQHFTYDNLNRLTTFASSDSSIQQNYGIDAWGNLNQAGTLAFNVSYDGNNHIAGFGYDAAGDLTSFNNGAFISTYGYDAEGKLINAGGATYIYDANGERSHKDSGGTFTEYLQFNGQTLAEKNGDGSWNDYIFANGQRIAQAGSTTIFYHSNQIGSTDLITSSAGTPLASYTYYPYGVGPISDAQNHYLFTGKERDAESSLDYFGARYYASVMGRFMSPDDSDVGENDPSNPQSWNLYSYVQNNPLTNTDPDGHDCVTQTRTNSTSENVEVSSGNCTGASGNGTTQTYVNGTVKLSDIHAGADGHSIDIGYTDSNGNSGVQNANSAPVPENSGIAVGYNQAAFGSLANTSLGVKYVGTPIMNAISYFLGGLLSSTAPMITGIEAGGSTGSTYLYEKLGPNGEHLKYGITNNPATRYSPGQLAGGRLKILARGSRSEMLALERSLHEKMPIGPEEGQSFYIEKQVNNGLKPPPY